MIGLVNTVGALLLLALWLGPPLLTWRLLGKRQSELDRRLSRLEKGLGDQQQAGAAAVDVARDTSRESLDKAPQAQDLDQGEASSQAAEQESVSEAGATPAASPVPSAPDSSQQPPSPPPSTTPPAPTDQESPVGPGWEERIGARLPVWVGSVALALAGVFLVRYSLDQGWIGPTARVTLGVLLGIALLGGGELIARRDERIAAGLSAAGIAGLYATFLAASELYALIPSSLSFVLMALVTALAVVLSLRRGQVVAVVGLVGGFSTPRLLAGTDIASPIPLLAYLLLLQAALVAVAQRRAWTGLSAATLVGALLWVMPWLAGSAPAGINATALYIYLLATLALFTFAATQPHAAPERSLAEEEEEGAPLTRLVAWAATAGAVMFAAALGQAAGHRPADWLFLGLLGAASIVVGRRLPRSEGLPWIAAAFIALSLASWGMLELPSFGVRAQDAVALRSRFLLATGGLGALFSVAGYIALWGAPRTWPWAALSAASAVGYLLLAYGVTEGSLPGGPLGVPWGGWALGVGAALVAAATPVARRRQGMPDGHTALAALAAGATACAALAVPLELERQWITVAWALQVGALAWLSRRLAVPALRHLAWPLAALVAARLLLNPAVLTDYPSGSMPVLNWLLYGYGIPIAALAFAAWHARQERDLPLARSLEGIVSLLGLALVTLQIMHAFGRGDLDHAWPWLEMALVPVAWMLYGLALRWLDRLWPGRVPRLSGAGIGVTGLTLAILIQLGPGNPLLADHAVGSWPVLNGLLLAYGAPAALALVLARQLLVEEPTPRNRTVATVLAATALALLFALTSLEVRHLFQGSTLQGATSTTAERWAYSVAWILYGLLLLGVGFLRRSALAGRASLLVFVAAVIKVFLVDMRQLDDLYRVLSFLGLGLALLLLAWGYQRLLPRVRRVES